MKKDWTGNSVSTFANLAASNHSNTTRQEHDYYATPPEATEALINNFCLPQVILEPCCGEGLISKTLEAHGHIVYSSDLYDYGYGISGIDFLQLNSLPPDCNCIVTNFPYKYVTPMTIKALDLLNEGGILASFVKINFLETQGRYTQIFAEQPPRYIYAFSKRVNCWKNGAKPATSSAVFYCWVVWIKGYIGNPEFIWIR